jgi:hypothetical protein
MVMEEEIAIIENKLGASSADQNLPLSDTLALVSSEEAELARLERELAELGMALPKKKIRLEALEKEIKPMEMDKEGLERFASEAIRMRDSARAEGKADRENMGRWYGDSNSPSEGDIYSLTRVAGINQCLKACCRCYKALGQRVAQASDPLCLPVKLLTNIISRAT